MRTRLLLLAAAVVAPVLAVPSAQAASPSPCAGFDAVSRHDDPVLGSGLTLTMPREANYVPAGGRPVVTLNGTVPLDGAVLSYSVRDRRRVLLSKALTVGQTIDLALPKAVAGAYQLEARLTRSGRETGKACLRYGIGLPGALVDFANLPAGKDWGGGGAARQVALNRQLGTGVARMQMDVGAFLKDPKAYDATWAAAAARAKAAGVRLVVQIGQGGAAERAAVARRTWEKTVRQIVARQKGAVAYWEAWNEPNFTRFYGGTPSQYVNEVLKPFARAVHSADPKAKVVGGSAYGTDPGWWTAFGRAGGFGAVDVVAVHAYAWARSYEASGTVTGLTTLIRLKKSFGAGAKPLWDTESGYKSTIDMGGPWAQADYVTRKLLWERTLGIWTQNYQLEGGWEDWSVVDYFRGVKPAAMAMSTQRTVLAGRTFKGWVSTGISGLHAARFVDRAGTTVTAVWTSGASRRLALHSRHAVVDETGAPGFVQGAMTVRGDVQYVRAAKGQGPL